jgi:hypothetical protein
MLRRYLARRKMRWAVRRRAWYRATGFTFLTRQQREVFMVPHVYIVRPLLRGDIQAAVERLDRLNPAK